MTDELVPPSFPSATVSDVGPSGDESDPSVISQTMPYVLLSLLERRYLSRFETDRWVMATPGDDGGRPVLHEVLGMGRPRSDQDMGPAMAQVLSAAHAPGQAIVMTLFGDGSRHRLFFGARRTFGASGSTEDFLVGQASALRAHLPGLEFGPVLHAGDPALRELAAMVHAAPSVAALTGIPSPRMDGDAAAYQGIDRLIATMGEKRYVVQVIAHPLPASETDVALDLCRRLKSEVHGWVNRLMNQSRSNATTKEVTQRDKAPLDNLPLALSAVALFCQLSGALSGVSLLGQLTEPLSSASNLYPGIFGRPAGPETTRQTGSSQTLTQAGTVELLNANAAACEALLDAHIHRLELARATGWWHTSVYLAAEHDQALAAVTGAMRGLCMGDTSTLDPIRVLQPPTWLVREAMVQAQLIRLLPAAKEAPRHPLGQPYETLGTCLATKELSVLFGLPRREIPGIPIRDIGEFALSAPSPLPNAVEVGTLLDALGRPLASVSLTAASLNRHTLITGMSGYGKTTTAKNLLLRAYADLNVPFLVIEPVKTEYRQLLQHAELRGQVRVFSIGGDSGALPLRMNPFVPVPGAPLLRHIDLLKAVFSTSFSMYAVMPYVLEQSMIEIYTERGWNLETAANDVLGGGPTRREDRFALVPSLADLHAKVGEVLGRKDYAGEIHRNMGAGLCSWLRSLMVGAKGGALNARRSLTAAELFTRPTVIELHNLRDDTEKTFVMALLFSLLYEFAEAGRSSGAPGQHPLQHLTLIEEAHRLLGANRGLTDANSGNPQAGGVAMFASMLTEMGAYGEGFVIVDQIPTMLAPETLKNASVKIVHRLAAPDDRRVLAASMNLNEDQSKHLVTLPAGRAVVLDNRMQSAALVQVGPLASPVDEGTGSAPSIDRSYLHRDGGCIACPAPCMFLDRAERIVVFSAIHERVTPDPETWFRAVLLSSADSAWERWTEWRASFAGVAIDDHQPADQLEGITFCAVTRAAVHWLAGVTAGRSAVAAHEHARSASVRPASMNPMATTSGAILAADRASRVLGRLARVWLAAHSLNPACVEAFQTAQSELRTLISASPPGGLAGCQGCPAICRMLPAIWTRFVSHRSSITAGVTADLPVETRLHQVTQAITELEVLPADLDESHRHHALYCALTLATIDAPTSGSDLLAALRPPSRDQG